MKEQTIPLVGSLTGRNTNPSSFSTFDQVFTNCYPELAKNPVTGQGQAWLCKRLGYRNPGGPAANYVGAAGGINWTGTSVLALPYIDASGNLRVYDRSSNQIGSTIANLNGESTNMLSETLISGIPALTLVARKSTSAADGMWHAWYYMQGAASWTEITDVDFPPNQNGTVTGGISGTTLTTTVSSTGVNLPVGAYLTGTGVASLTRIVSIGTAVAGVGTYTVSVSQTVSVGTTIYCGTPLASNIVHKDGYAFVLDINGNIWNSDLNSLSGWTSTSFLTAQASPDGGRGLAVTNDYVIAFSATTTEFFVNTGNATGTVLSRVKGATVNIGIAVRGPSLYCRSIGGVVYFVGSSDVSGTLGVYKISGTTVTKISNGYIDKLGVGFIVGAVNMHGMEHVIFSGTSGGQFAYCTNTGIWWKWTVADGGDLMTAVCDDSAAINVYTQNLDGDTYYVQNNSPIYSDGSNAVVMTVQTAPLDQGTNRKKFFHAAELIADRRSTSGNTSISWSDDDYQNFSTARTIDLSTGSRRITRLGSTQRAYNNKRAWKITETVNAPFRGESLKLWYTEGAT